MKRNYSRRPNPIMIVILRDGSAVNLSRFGLDLATAGETYAYLVSLGVGNITPEMDKQELLRRLAESLRPAMNPTPAWRFEAAQGH